MTRVGQQILPQPFVDRACLFPDGFVVRLPNIEYVQTLQFVARHRVFSCQAWRLMGQGPRDQKQALVTCAHEVPHLLDLIMDHLRAVISIRVVITNIQL